jgi:hypothetical protein
MTWRSKSIRPYTVANAAADSTAAAVVGVLARAGHSSTFRLNVSHFLWDALGGGSIQ